MSAVRTSIPSGISRGRLRRADPLVDDILSDGDPSGHEIDILPAQADQSRRLDVITSNRGPDEWLATFADPVRAQAAIDRFTSNDLVSEGESYRKRLKPKSPGDNSPAAKAGQTKG